MLATVILKYLPQIVAGLLALLGTAGTLYFFIGTRCRHAMCGQCGYDTSGQIEAAQRASAAAATLTCPECGTTVASAAQWLERRHPGNWLLILAAMMIMAAPIVGTWPHPQTIALRLFTPSHITVDQVVFGPFTATLESVNWSWDILTESERYSGFCADRLAITGPDGAVVQSRLLEGKLGNEVEPWRAAFVGQNPSGQGQTPAVCGRGEDVSGDGVPDLVVSETITVPSASGTALYSGTAVSVYSHRSVDGKYDLTVRRLGDGAFTEIDSTGQRPFIRRLPVFFYAWTPRPVAIGPTLVLRSDRGSGKYCFDAAFTKDYTAPVLADLLAAAPENPELGEGNRALLLQRFLAMLACGEGDLALAHVHTFGKFCCLSDPDFRDRFRLALQTTALSTEWMAEQPEPFRLWLGPLK